MVTVTSKRFDSLIGTDMRIEGDVSFLGVLRLEGSICGNVRTAVERPGTLLVSKQARIDGEVAVPYVVVNGTINGRLTGINMLTLESGARVYGDVSYKRMDVLRGTIAADRLANYAAVDLESQAELNPASSGLGPMVPRIQLGRHRESNHQTAAEMPLLFDRHAVRRSTHSWTFGRICIRLWYMPKPALARICSMSKPAFFAAIFNHHKDIGRIS